MGVKTRIDPKSHSFGIGKYQRFSIDARDAIRKCTEATSACPHFSLDVDDGGLGLI